MQRQLLRVKTQFVAVPLIEDVQRMPIITRNNENARPVRETLIVAIYFLPFVFLLHGDGSSQVALRFFATFN